MLVRSLRWWKRRIQSWRGLGHEGHDESWYHIWASITYVISVYTCIILRGTAAPSSVANIALLRLLNKTVFCLSLSTLLRKFRILVLLTIPRQRVKLPHSSCMGHRGASKIRSHRTKAAMRYCEVRRTRQATVRWFVISLKPTFIWKRTKGKSTDMLYITWW